MKPGYKPIPVTAAILIALVLLVGCSDIDTGTLEFYANGEDFVRQGFTSKDGWDITFETVEIAIDKVSAYQTDPPYDSRQNSSIEANVAAELEESYVIDLAAGSETASPILFGTILDASTGHYNAISWQMTPGDNENSITMIGAARKNSEEILFKIGLNNEYVYSCGEYIGDSRKGVLEKDGSAELELTFHFDHIFGDGSLPANDDLNLSAPGFDPFANAAVDGILEINSMGLKESLNSEAYQMLEDILPTLGHVGEGHCHSERL